MGRDREYHLHYKPGTGILFWTTLELDIVIQYQTRYLPSWVKGLSYVEVLQGGQSSFHVQSSLFSVVKQLELRGAYFERYCRNWLSFTEWNEHFLIYLFRNHRNGHWNLQNCHHCVQHPWKLTSRDYWSSRNERKPLSKQNMFQENAVEYLRNSEC